MIVVDNYNKSENHYISPSALTFTENYQGRADVVSVSLAQGASIMVKYDGVDGLGWGDDLDYKRWKLTGATVGLNPDGAQKKFYIYARLSRVESNASVVFSLRLYNIEGVYTDDNGKVSEASAEYWYVRIGELSAPKEDGKRDLRYDSGKLGTREAEAEKNDMFELKRTVGDNKQIEPKFPFSEISVVGDANLSNIIIDGKTIDGIANSKTTHDTSEQSDNDIATPRYVQKHGDWRYLNKLTSSEQEVKGVVHFLADVTIAGEVKAKTLSIDEDAEIGGDLAVLKDAYITGNQTIKKKQTVAGDQIVQGQATFHSGARGDGYTEQGDIIQGWNITNDGIASFAKVKTPSMQVYELTLNRKTAVQGEFVFSDGEVVESVEFLGADTYLLTVRSPYEGYTTTFKVDDILYSNINIIGESSSSAKTGKCWMRVIAVDGDTITAFHYPYAECPARENIDPVPYMTITRHGNISDKTRQDLFIISSETSSLTMLRGVSAPIVSSEGLYGVVLGRLPDTLLEYINKSGHEYVNGKDPYVYARGVIVQDLIMLDYQGKPIPTEAYRGEWQAKTKYYNKGNVYDSVTHQGSLWQCLAAETTEEPSDNSKAWRKKISKGDDGDMPTIFTITSSLTSIHQDSSGKLNTNILDIWVNAVGAPSNFEIKDQATLDAYGLSVWFNIDEQEDVRTKLIIGGADAIEVEEGGAIIVAEEDDDDGGAYITLESESIDISSVQSKINIYLVRDADEDGFGVDENRMYIPVMRDGQRGRMLYPAGVYDSTKEYMIENNSAPFVKEGSTFYVLVWEGGYVKGIQPSTDTQGIYWRPFTYMNYLFAEFLMAPYAQLGSDKGAVFYDRYLFSQYGIDAEGNFDTFSSHMDDMWADDGSLSGTFTPSLFINMYAGETKTNKLAETFQEYRYFDGDELFANEIRFNETYCVKYTPRIGWSGNQGELSASPRLLSMPLSTNITYNDSILVEAQHDTELDGVRSVILSKANRAWSRKMRGTFETITGVNGFTSISELSSASLLLCAEPRLFNPYAWRYNGTNLRNVALDSNEYEMGRFVINGVFTDFIMVEPAQQVILRSCYSDGTLFWYVENAEDFEEVPFEVLYGTEPITVFDESNGELISFNEYNPNVGWDSSGEVYGLNRKTFATKSIARFYKEKMNGSGLAMTVSVSTVGQSGAVGDDADWNWEQDIDGVTIS